VPAAGAGSRVGGPVPKQYLELLGQPILARTLEKLAAVSQINTCVVAIDPQDKYFSTITLPDNLNIQTVSGGRQRSDSVLNCLEFLNQGLAQTDDWVLVHDAARPLINPHDIQKLLNTIADSKVGGILAMPATDTVKYSKHNKIEKTLDRENVWLAQTPQVFRFKVLYEALLHAKKQNIKVTDEAQAVELIGLSPVLVSASKTNIKLTHAEDFALAEFILTGAKCE